MEVVLRTRYDVVVVRRRRTSGAHEEMKRHGGSNGQRDRGSSKKNI